MLPVVAGLLLAVAAGGRGSAAAERESPPGSRFVCTSLPLDAVGAGCPLPPVPMQGGALPPEEELKATVLQLRETVLQQKETIGNQREAIRELTGKLSRCESADGKSAAGTWKKEAGKGKDTMGDLPRDPAQVIDQLSRTMQTLKDRLESLEVGPGRGVGQPARPAARHLGTTSGVTAALGRGAGATAAIDRCGHEPKLEVGCLVGLSFCHYSSARFNGKITEGLLRERVLPLCVGRLWFSCLSPA